jgi:hypothetical protein
MRLVPAGRAEDTPQETKKPLPPPPEPPKPGEPAGGGGVGTAGDGTCHCHALPAFIARFCDPGPGVGATSCDSNCNTGRFSVHNYNPEMVMEFILMGVLGLSLFEGTLEIATTTS